MRRSWMMLAGGALVVTIAVAALVTGIRLHDRASNVIFGSLQKLAALQLGLSPLLMASANSAGGVMAKMISPQNVVVATTATGRYGKEGLRS